MEMADGNMETSLGHTTMSMTESSSEQTVLPPITEVKPLHTMGPQKTTLTCSSGLKDDDIEMDARTPDNLSDTEVMESVLQDLEAVDHADRETTFQSQASRKQSLQADRDKTSVSFQSDYPHPVPSQTRDGKWVSRQVQLDEDHLEEELDGPTVVSPPPTGHGYDFFCTMKKHGRYGDKDEYFPDEELEFLNKQKLITKVIAAVAPKPKLLPSNKDNRNTTRRGMKFIDLMSKVPLTTVWHRTTQILAMIVFIVNVIVAFYDIVRDFKYLYYKVPALILTLTENVILLVVWLVLKSKRFQTQPWRATDTSGPETHSRYTWF